MQKPVEVSRKQRGHPQCPPSTYSSYRSKSSGPRVPATQFARTSRYLTNVIFEHLSGPRFSGFLKSSQTPVCQTKRFARQAVEMVAEAARVISLPDFVERTIRGTPELPRLHRAVSNG